MNYLELLYDWVRNMDECAQRETCIQFGLIEDEKEQLTKEVQNNADKPPVVERLTKKQISDLRSLRINVREMYIRAFEEQMGLELNELMPDGMNRVRYAENDLSCPVFGDYYLDIETVFYCVEQGLTFEQYQEWHDFMLECEESERVPISVFVRRKWAEQSKKQ